MHVYKCTNATNEIVHHIQDVVNQQIVYQHISEGQYQTDSLYLSVSDGQFTDLAQVDILIRPEDGKHHPISAVAKPEFSVRPGKCLQDGEYHPVSAVAKPVFTVRLSKCLQDGEHDPISTIAKPEFSVRPCKCPQDG